MDVGVMVVVVVVVVDAADAAVDVADGSRVPVKEAFPLSTA